MEDRKAPGMCVDCGNDAFIRLASQKGGEEMICGHCYADRIREGRIELARVRRTDAGPAKPRRL